MCYAGAMQVLCNTYSFALVLGTWKYYIEYPFLHFRLQRYKIICIYQKKAVLLPLQKFKQGINLIIYAKNNSLYAFLGISGVYCQTT